MPGSSSKHLKGHGCARLLLETLTTHKTKRVEHTTDGKGRRGKVAKREKRGPTIAPAIDPPIHGHAM